MKESASTICGDYVAPAPDLQGIVATLLPLFPCRHFDYA
jgi:hypothetical protein